MKAEIIAVGTELLLGEIINTNAAWLARELAMVGIHSYYQTVVGDNEYRIQEACLQAEKRADVIVLTGGLGPTADDITKDAVSSLLEEPLVIDQDALEAIYHSFRKRQRVMTDNNSLQARTFQNGTCFVNHVGHAVGTAIQAKNTWYILLPGPPHEMKYMFEQEVFPFLQTEFANELTPLVSRTLRFFGIGESQLAEKLSDLIEQQENPTLAVYAGENDIRLRITMSGSNEQESDKAIEEIAQQVRQLTGDDYYGEGEQETLEKIVVSLLKENGWTISAAESLTGGLFQSTLVRVPSCGTVFRGGIVTYEEAIKEEVLGVPRKLLDEQGMVSEACAKEMAERCLEMFQTDFAISFTGVAGPEELEGHPAGTIWIGLKERGQEAIAVCHHYDSNRQGNRQKAVLSGLDFIRRTILDKSKV